MKFKLFILLFILTNIASSQTVHFKFTSRTGLDASIIGVPFDIHPNVNGVRLTDGDEIGVFNMANRCCGATVWASKSTKVVAWGDDPETTLNDGFTDSEVISFRIWLKSTNKEYYARPRFKSDPALSNGVYHSNGLLALDSLTGYKLVKVENRKEIPNKFNLHQNYPNPFNSTTKILYELSTAGNIHLEILEISGKTLLTLFQGFKSPGKYDVEWNGKDKSGIPLSSGIYLYRLTFQSKYKEVKKMTLMK